MTTIQTFDVAVVGAGVFGAWTAYQLRRKGAEVVLVDAYGPGNSRASSGGESRMIRMGYGPDEIYTRMAQRSLALWQELFDHGAHNEISPHLFEPTGILWLAQENDPYCEATLETLKRCQIKYDRLNRAELVGRYPQLELGEISWGILEPDSGVLMARQAVQAVVAEARTGGVVYLNEAILRDNTSSKTTGFEDKLNQQSTVGNLQSVKTVAGEEIFATQFVFACGPWLPKIFPLLLDQLIHVTRQEVFSLAFQKAMPQVASDRKGCRHGSTLVNSSMASRISTTAVSSLRLMHMVRRLILTPATGSYLLRAWLRRERIWRVGCRSSGTRR